MINLLKVLPFLLVSVSFSVSASPIDASTLVKINRRTGAYEGLTTQGLHKLKELRDAIRTRHNLFESEFKGVTAIHHAATVARSFKGNMFLYGPPGGAKSGVIKWMFKGEDEPAFQMQLHQMMTEQAFIGGQNFEKAKLGEFEVNTKGSLADFKVALIDEAEKGNPSALAALLSLLNEREILAGNQVIKAVTETVFATSNANLPEIFRHFLENGQGSTAPAFLNRFQFKCFAYNWLPDCNQAALDARAQKARYLKAIGQAAPTAAKDEIFLTPPTLDWDALRLFTNVIVNPSPLFMVTFREFVNEMRVETNKAVRASEERHAMNSREEPFVYFPSCDYTERLRQQIPEVVLISAMIDFLLSDLANDNQIALETSKQLELGPLSLWRTYLIMTTVGPGEVRLVHNPEAENKIDVAFDFSIDESNARDEREQLLIRNLKDEQDRFRRILSKHLKNVQTRIKDSMRLTGTCDLADYEGFDYFELRALKQ